MMEHTKIYGWNGIRYSAADVSLVVVPELGGRIISLSVDGQEIFFVQKEHAGETFSFSDA
ncbi:MAG: hypothetical protein JNN05_04045, partial [Candidatus Omnitrophica bacterium]|nr:hypothetical protein [Candidatus Omnitrophota bacterium]